MTHNAQQVHIQERMETITMMLTNMIKKYSFLALVSLLLGRVTALSQIKPPESYSSWPLTSATNGVTRRVALCQAAAVVTATPLFFLQFPSNAIADTTSSKAAPKLPSTGAKAPYFELPNSRNVGKTTSLQDLTKSGKWTVLYFYPAAFTKGCTLEARNFQRDLDDFRQLNAQIVGVSVDPVEKNAQFCTAEGLDFYMLTDAGGAVSRLYGSALSVAGFGTFSNRQTYLIDPQGNLRWVFTDVESRIPRHSMEVLDKLRELEGVEVIATA